MTIISVQMVKYEVIDYFEYATCPELFALMKVFVDGYTNERLHSSLGSIPFEAIWRGNYDLV